MKGKFGLKEAEVVANDLLNRLKPACERIVVAGSIRRRKSYVSDVELLCIPKHDGLADLLDREIQSLIYRGVLDFRLNKRGSRVYGPKNKLMVHIPSGMAVDIFSTDELCWPVALVVRTGGKVTNQRIATAAIRKGWHLQAYGAGFSTPDGDVVCRSEREVFELVDLRYLEPWGRD